GTKARREPRVFQQTQALSQLCAIYSPFRPFSIGEGAFCRAQLGGGELTPLISLTPSDIWGVVHSGKNSATPYRGQRKFSTSINSLASCSNCVYKIDRPSGDTVRPSPSASLAAIGRSNVATTAILPVAKFRN